MPYSFVRRRIFQYPLRSDAYTRCPEPPPEAPFPIGPHQPTPRSAAEGQGRRSRLACEGSLRLGEHRVSSSGDGRRFYPQILRKTQKVKDVHVAILVLVVAIASIVSNAVYIFRELGWFPYDRMQHRPTVFRHQNDTDVVPSFQEQRNDRFRRSVTR